MAIPGFRKIISKIPDLQDLGIGSRVASDPTQRLLNRNRSKRFNLRRMGLSFIERYSPYHYLIQISWPRFYLLVIAFIILLNLLFAGLYTALGKSALTGIGTDIHGLSYFLYAFFFSIQTFTTVGYGTITPFSTVSNFVATFESIIGLLAFALATGMTFARFAQPNIRILFSDKALISPYSDGFGFMFRMANQRNNELIEANVQLMLTFIEEQNGQRIRRYAMLPLERSHVMFFPLSWTVVHPIDADSPFHQRDMQWFEDHNAEVLILFSAYDETYSQTVHTRYSFHWKEWVWNARYNDMYADDSDGAVAIDLNRINAYSQLD